jgi:hypothetical protein
MRQTFAPEKSGPAKSRSFASVSRPFQTLADLMTPPQRLLPPSVIGHDFGRIAVKASGSAADKQSDAGDPGTANPQPQPMDTSAASKNPELSLSSDSYDDTGKADESHKNIKFSVKIPSGLEKKDYALVNKLKGHEKKGDGTYFKVKMYESTVDFNFSSFQVDSVDKDPVYWSDTSARWNYDASGDGFSATDDPGPALSSEHGAEYAVNFKLGIYKLADLPMTTTGSISATPIAEKDWQYSVKVDDKGKFTHPSI